MQQSVEELQESFYKQAKTCGDSSLLYHDLLNILGNDINVIYFMQNIMTKRSFVGNVEAVLTLTAFFHYSVLKYPDQFSQLKQFFKTQGGNYHSEDFNKLEQIIKTIWQDNQPQITEWLLNTKLQTNEVSRCNVIYPALLSLQKQKVNLIELGCSAGLILLMDLYSYEYFDEEKKYINTINLPLLKSKVNDVDQIKSIFESNKIEIKSRIGFDLFPLDLNDPENVLKLRASLWDDSDRMKRLEQAIELFKKEKDKLNLSLFALDYTLDLSSYLENIIDKSAEIVFYSSVSTYQIPVEVYNSLLSSLNNLALHFNKTIYFIEFEGLRDKNEQKKVTKDEPFHLTIHEYPQKSSYEFARSHFHGNSLTIF